VVIQVPLPYKSVKELPEPVQHALPAHAREIFLKAVNNAWEQYREPKARRDPKETREAVAFKVAWKAVEEVYEKDPGSRTWKRKA
jgi:cation transport regulator